MKRAVVFALIVLAIGYAGIQSYLSIRPPFRLSGYATLESVRPGDQAVLGFDLWDQSPFPYTITNVVMMESEFRLDRACAVNVSLGFAATRGGEKPAAYQYCQPLSAISRDWDVTIVMLDGQIIGGPRSPDGPRFEIRYRSLGWPHRVVLRKPLYTMAQ